MAGRAADRLRGRAGAKGVELTLVETGAHTAFVDPGLIGQAVWNLTDNAIKYSPAGGRVAIRVGREGDDIVIVSAEETTPAPASATRIRPSGASSGEDAARTHGTATDGTGLVLAIVRAVAEAMAAALPRRTAGRGRSRDRAPVGGRERRGRGLSARRGRPDANRGGGSTPPRRSSPSRSAVLRERRQPPILKRL